MRLFRPFPWWSLAYLCLGIVVAPALAASLVLTVLYLPLAVIVPAPFLWLARLFGLALRFDRARFALIGEPAPGQSLPCPDPTAPAQQRLLWLLAEPAHRTAAGYALVRVALAALHYTLVYFGITWPLLVLTGMSAAAIVGYTPEVRQLLFPDPTSVAVGIPLLLLALLFLAPALIRALTQLDSWTTRTLLGAPDAAALQRRVGDLVTARDRTVSAADAERVQLERNLHDGAQQRLIALSVLLGQAEARLSTTTQQQQQQSDETTLALIRRARLETVGTIDEIRTLTRGLRPPILQSRGLDAALSAVASRLPIQVAIDSRLQRRLDPTVEAVLYFAVAEALTNVAKHAAGSAATVSLSADADLARVTVTDTGPGGASPDTGTGLRGLADRLLGVDGQLYLSSPPGGPTVVTVEVPCASS